MSEYEPGGNDGDGEEHECPNCSRSFTTRHGLGRHHSHAHDEPINEYEARIREWDYPCSECSRGFDSHMGMMQHLSRTHGCPVSVAKLTEWYLEDKKSAYTIGERIQRDHRRVLEWLRDAGVEIRDRNTKSAVPDLRDEEWLRSRYLDSEMSTVAIADELECGSSTVGAWLERHEIPARPRSPTGADSPHWRGGKSIYDGVKRALPLPWRKQRAKQRERGEGVCRLCGERRREDEQHHDVNHIVPVLSGGTNGDYNLMSLCHRCHKKGEMYVRQYIPVHLVDWPDEELPEGRERWTPPEPTAKQATIAQFATADD